MACVLCLTLNPAIDMTIAVDGLTLGEVNRATASQVDAAGKALNAAQVLADLGLDTLASGFLGDENDGIFEQLFAKRQQKAEQIAHIGTVKNHFVKVDGNTRTNIKLTHQGQTTDINGIGFAVSANDKQALLDTAVQLTQTVDAVLIAGSLPKGYELDDFENLLSALCKTPAKIAVDVSGQALKVAVKYPLWLIKPNSDELTESFGVPCATLAEQQALFAKLNANIDNIVISMGADGVHWLQRHAVWRATPPKMTVASTVGAGDTLVSGMMAGLLKDLPPEQTLKQATALSAHAVSIVGFEAASGERLATLMAQVGVEQL